MRHQSSPKRLLTCLEEKQAGQGQHGNGFQVEVPFGKKERKVFQDLDLRAVAAFKFHHMKSYLLVEIGDPNKD